MGNALLFGLVVLIGGVTFSFGLFGHGNSILIGIGLAIFAVCAIFGVQPNFMGPAKKD
jgi:hypothetical protein